MPNGFNLTWHNSFKVFKLGNVKMKRKKIGPYIIIIRSAAKARSP